MEEYINRYKSIKLTLRLLILLTLGLLPGVNEYINESPQALEEYESAKVERDSAKRDLDAAKSRKGNLPKLEQQLADTENQLSEASKKLPDQFVLDKILQKTATIAQEVGVKLILFYPQQAIPSATAFKYAKMPIQLELTGNFQQITTFFDKLVHLDMLIHLENIKMNTYESRDVDSNDKKDKTTPEVAKKKQETQKDLRSKALIKTKANLVVYRTLSTREQSAIDSLSKKNEDPKDGKKPKKKAKPSSQEGES